MGRWRSNPSGKCSYERPTRGTVCGTMRSMFGADAGGLALNYQSLSVLMGTWGRGAFSPEWLEEWEVHPAPPHHHSACWGHAFRVSLYLQDFGVSLHLQHSTGFRVSRHLQPSRGFRASPHLQHSPLNTASPRTRERHEISLPGGRGIQGAGHGVS